MIKSSAMFSAHAIHVLLRNTLISLIVIFIALFYWLKVGIEANRFVIGPYKIEQLYIKLDKKLTLRAKKVVIPKKRESRPLTHIDEVFDKIKFLFTFFHEIHLENIYFDNTNLQFHFQNNILDLNTENYHIRGTIERAERLITVKISKCLIKKQHINLNGNLNYNLKTEKITLEGDYDAYHIQGRFAAQKEDEHVDFKITSTKFDDLRTLIETIPMQKSIKAWIVDKVEAKHYTLNSLSGEATLNEEGLALNFDTLKASVLFEKVKIHYQKNLAPILADSFLLTYKNRALYFDLTHPSYQHRSLEKSKIAITGLGKKATLHLDLHIQSAIDKTLHTVLDAYAIKIPVKHQGKDAQIDVSLTIPLGKHTPQQKKRVHVEVEVGEGNVWYKKIKLPIRTAHVLFDNSKKENIVVQATLKKGTIELGKTKLPVLSGAGVYRQGIVVLKDVHVKEDWYDSYVNGEVNLIKKTCKLSLDVQKIKIGEQKTFVRMKNKKLSLVLDYHNGVKAWVPELEMRLLHKDTKLEMDFKQIKKLKPYIHNLAINFDNGTLKLIQNKRGTYTFSGLLKRKACFFYDANNTCHTQVPYSGTVDTKGIEFYAFEKRLHYSSSKSRIVLHRINIDLKKLIDSLKMDTKSQKTSNKLVIVGKNSTLRYNHYKLLTDSYDIEISQDGDITAIGSLEGDIVKFSKKGKHFALKAFRVTDKMLHPLIGFDGLKGGRYTLTLKGNPEKKMQGKIIVEGGVMSDFKAYNNTLAFINALPAIATLSNPGFSEKGFTINEGVVDYQVYNSNHFIFDSIYVKGTSATLVGKGTLDIQTNTIAMHLAIRTARELGSIVGNLPLLGYILMGQDKSMTVGLEVSGTLIQPQIQTSAAEEILTLPLQLIKRTLESPAHIINK